MFEPQPLESLSFVLPLAGGLLVGLSAGLYLLLNGRVAGISGLTAAATGLSKGGPRTLSLGFIAGLLGGAALASALIRRPEVQITSEIWLLVLRSCTGCLARACGGVRCLALRFSI